MSDHLAYLTDSLTLAFEANITEKNELPDGRVDIMLEKTYFYPTGGGQPHDTGLLGEARVLDVFKGADGRVIHRVDRDLLAPVVPARIDPDRRLDHMQHHSAQHLLSGVLAEVLQLETLSAKISADTPSTIDVPDAEVSWADLERVEQRAQRLIFENRAIKIYFVSGNAIQTVPFRRPPKVAGQIRVVEIDSFDYSACGGTHCPQTGMIGSLKILKTERKNKKLRLHFVAGRQALAQFQTYHRMAADLSRQFSANPEEVVALVGQQAAQLQETRQALKTLQAERLEWEAGKLARRAEAVDDHRLVTAFYPDWPAAELRELARRLHQEEKLVALLASYDGHKLSLVVSCSPGSGVDARQVLNEHLARIGGRGGGDAHLAQGGGPATPDQAEQFLTAAK